MKAQTRKIDWPAIEKDYRAGSMSNVDLAAWYSITEGAIRKRAKAHGWVRGGTIQSEGGRAPATVLSPETTSPEAIVGRGRNLTLRMLDELDATTSRQGELQALIDGALDEGDKQREALDQALSLKGRADVLKALALAAKTLSEVGGAAASGKKAERQAGAAKTAAGGGKFAPPSAPKLVVSNK